MDNGVLDSLSIIDTPGILSGEKQRIDRGCFSRQVVQWPVVLVDTVASRQGLPVDTLVLWQGLVEGLWQEAGALQAVVLAVGWAPGKAALPVVSDVVVAQVVALCPMWAMARARTSRRRRTHMSATEEISQRCGQKGISHAS